MKLLLAAALVIGFAAQTGEALAYACNNNYYVNSSRHLVHSPSCGQEHEKRTAECRDGSVSYSEHHRGNRCVQLTASPIRGTRPRVSQPHARTVDEMGPLIVAKIGSLSAASRSILPRLRSSSRMPLWRGSRHSIAVSRV